MAKAHRVAGRVPPASEASSKVRTPRAGCVPRFSSQGALLLGALEVWSVSSLMPRLPSANTHGQVQRDILRHNPIRTRGGDGYGQQTAVDCERHVPLGLDTTRNDSGGLDDIIQEFFANECVLPGVVGIAKLDRRISTEERTVGCA